MAGQVGDDDSQALPAIWGVPHSNITLGAGSEQVGNSPGEVREERE